MGQVLAELGKKSAGWVSRWGVDARSGVGRVVGEGGVKDGGYLVDGLGVGGVEVCYSRGIGCFALQQTLLTNVPNDYLPLRLAIPCEVQAR
jgi:hypothetical protein